MIDKIRSKLSNKLHDVYAIYLDWILATGSWNDAGEWIDSESLMDH